jgi:Glycosyl transferase family 2
MTIIDPNADIHTRLAIAEAVLNSIGQKIDPAINHIDIAVLIPCFNESATIADVVRSFHIALPQARVYVYDNNSHDNTAAEARAAGAIVRREPLQGKGHLVRRMFTDIEADVYVMVDGDGAYDAAAAPRLVSRLIDTQADMVVGARITQDKAACRQGLTFGNRLLSGLVAGVFGDRFTDMFSGYRAFSRRFAKSYPALASGFGAETELTVHALDLDMITAEIQTTYIARPQGKVSRLSPLRDGLRILVITGRLMRDKRPFALFGSLAGAGLVAAGLLALALHATDFFPTAIAVGALVILSSISLLCGLILEAISLGRREFKRIAYSQVESLAAKLERLSDTRMSLGGLRNPDIDRLRAQVLAENPIHSPNPRRSRIN